MLKNLNYEFQDRLNVTIRATDEDKAYIEEDFVIQVLDANDAPTDLLLEPAFIAENRPEGIEVGTFRQMDPDGEYDPLDTGEEIEQTEFFNETFPGAALEDGWVEELNNAESWTYSVKNNQLEIQEINATVHNTVPTVNGQSLP